MGLVLPMLLFACGAPPPAKGVKGTVVSEAVIEDTGDVDIAGVRFRFEQRQMLNEQLGGCDFATMVTDYQHLCSTDEGLLLRDERDDSVVSLGEFEHHSSARLPDGDIVLAIDGALYTLEDKELVSVDINMPVPIERLVTAKGGVWLWGLGQLFRWDGSVVSRIELAQHPYIYDFVASENRLYLSLPWLAVVDLSTEPLTTLHMDDRAPTSMAVDEDDSFWFVVDDQLVVQRRDEPERLIDMPEPIVSVTGPKIWVEGEGSVYRYHGASFSRHTVSGDAVVGVDDYGRFLQIGDGQLIRRSIDRPVVVVGLSESVLVRETVQLLPSDPDSLAALHAWVDDERLEVEGPPWVVVIEPERLDDGVHDLRFFSESGLGDSVDVFPFWVGELPEVDWSEIEALSEDHCIACHGGATLTDLTTKQGWEQRIDDIISQVSNQQMPLGGPYLSIEEITMIRGWKQGGFQ